MKNVVSEVFIDPNKIRKQSKIYRRLVREFEFCSKNDITPVLMAPFVDGSFYCFDDVHRGLHCQTLMQCLRPEDEDLCRNIREVLKFGNLRAVAELPDNVMNWIRRIPDMWEKRHGYMVDRPTCGDQSLSIYLIYVFLVRVLIQDTVTFHAFEDAF